MELAEVRKIKTEARLSHRKRKVCEGSNLGQGADPSKLTLKDNPELLDEIEAKVREALANAE